MGGSEDDSEKPIKEVKPAVFLMRVITHDWPDSYVTRYAYPFRFSRSKKLTRSVESCSVSGKQRGQIHGFSSQISSSHWLVWTKTRILTRT